VLEEVREVIVEYPMTRMSNPLVSIESNPLVSIEDNLMENNPLDNPFVGMVVILSDDGHDF